MSVFNGKKILVIGASGGLGQIFCKELTSQGATVIGSVRSKEKISEMKGEFDKLGKAAGDALSKNKEAEQFKKSIQSAYLNAKKVSQEYSANFKKY